jgi:hypothetical protein
METPNPNPLPLLNRDFEIKVTFNPSNGKVTITAPMEMKGDCIKALTTAIQIVVDYNPALVTKGNGNGN